MRTNASKIKTRYDGDMHMGCLNNVGVKKNDGSKK